MYGLSGRHLDQTSEGRSKFVEMVGTHVLSSSYLYDQERIYWRNGLFNRTGRGPKVVVQNRLVRPRSDQYVYVRHYSYRPYTGDLSKTMQRCTPTLPLAFSCHVWYYATDDDDRLIAPTTTVYSRIMKSRGSKLSWSKQGKRSTSRGLLRKVKGKRSGFCKLDTRSLWRRVSNLRLVMASKWSVWRTKLPRYCWRVCFTLCLFNLGDYAEPQNCLHQTKKRLDRNAHKPIG